MHVAKVLETAGSSIIESRKGRDEAITFAWREGVGVLSDAHSASRRAHKRITTSGLDCHIIEVNAGPSKPASNEKRNPVSVNGHAHDQAGGEGSSCSRAKIYGSTCCRRSCGEPNVMERDSLRACGVGDANTTRCRGPTDKKRRGTGAVVYLYLNIHCSLLPKGF
jgi:hypothetical protein